MQGFIKMSKYAGMREDLVQAGGGNSSFKINQETMAIKASGYQLADLTEKEGVAMVNPVKIKNFFLDNAELENVTDTESKEILNEAFIEGNRPSIETFLHAVSGRYTLHTHPIVVNAMTCRENGLEILKELFPEALMVPYATPGVELAKIYFKEYKKAAMETNKRYDVVFLQNHGLVVSGDTAESVIEKTEHIVNVLENYLKCDMSDYHKVTEIWNLFPHKVVWRITDSHILKAYKSMGGMWEHTFCPDCVVFLGKKVLEIEDDTNQDFISEFISEYGLPVVVCYKENLYILADSVKKALEIQSVLSFSGQVMELNIGEKCNFLSDKEQNFLLNWDAEKYRKSMK